MKWIEISKKTPKLQKDVLLFTKSGIKIGHKMSGSCYVDDHVYEIDNPTHWMPLPDYPKGED